MDRTRSPQTPLFWRKDKDYTAGEFPCFDASSNNPSFFRWVCIIFAKQPLVIHRLYRLQSKNCIARYARTSFTLPVTMVLLGEVMCDENLSFLPHRMKGDGSNLIQDRKYHITSYKQCFLGKEFVSWLLAKNEASSRPEAVDIGRKLLEAGVFRHGEFLIFLGRLCTCQRALMGFL